MVMAVVGPNWWLESRDGLLSVGQVECFLSWLQACGNGYAAYRDRRRLSDPPHKASEYSERAICKSARTAIFCDPGLRRVCGGEL
jgi:hypothetical protein